MRIARAEPERSAPAHAAAVEVHAIEVDGPVLLDVVENLQDIGFGQGPVTAAARPPEHRHLEKTGVLLHAAGVLEVISRVAVHVKRDRRGSGRIVVSRNHDLEWLTRSIDRRFVGPLLDTAQRGQRSRIVQNALRPLGQPRALRIGGTLAALSVVGAKLQILDEAAVGGEIRALENVTRGRRRRSVGRIRHGHGDRRVRRFARLRPA
jgi:hypothetical protein